MSSTGRHMHRHIAKPATSARSTPLSALDHNYSAPSSGNKTLRRRKATEDLASSITSILQAGSSDENAPPSSGSERSRKGGAGLPRKSALGERSVNFDSDDTSSFEKGKDSSKIIDGLLTPPTSQPARMDLISSDEQSTSGPRQPRSVPTSNPATRKRVRTTSIKTSPNPRVRKSAKLQVTNVLKRASRSPQPSPAKPVKTKKARSSLPIATTSSQYMVSVAGPVTPIRAVYAKPHALTTLGRPRNAIPLHMHRTPPKVDLTPSLAPPSPGEDPLLLTGTEVVKRWRKSRGSQEAKTVTLADEEEEVHPANTTIAWEDGAAPVSPVEDSGWGDAAAGGFNDDSDDGQWQDYDVPLVSPAPQDVSMRLATPVRASPFQASIEYTVPVVNSPANTSMRLSTPSKPPSKSPGVLGTSSLQRGHRRNYSVTSEGSLPSPRSSTSPQEAPAVLPDGYGVPAPQPSLLAPPTVDNSGLRALTPVSPPRAESSIFSSVLPQRSLSPPSESSSDNQLGLTFAASYVAGMSPATFQRILHSPVRPGPANAKESRQARVEEKAKNVIFSDATSVPDEPEWLDEEDGPEDGLSILKARLSLYRAARDIPSPVSKTAQHAAEEPILPMETTQLPEVHVDDVELVDEDIVEQAGEEDGYAYDDEDFMAMGDASDHGSEPDDFIQEMADPVNEERRELEEDEDAVNQSLMLAEPVLSDVEEDEDLEPGDHLLADLAEDELEELADEEAVIRDTTPEEDDDDDEDDTPPERTIEEEYEDLVEEAEVLRDTTPEEDEDHTNDVLQKPTPEEHADAGQFMREQTPEEESEQDVQDEEPEQRDYEDQLVPLRSPSPSPSPRRSAAPAEHEVVIEGTDPVKCAKIAMILKHHGLDVEEVIEPVDGFDDSPRSLKKRRESGRFEVKLRNSPLAKSNGNERRASFSTAKGDVTVPDGYLLEHVEASLAEGSMDASMLSALASNTTFMVGTPLRQAVLTRRTGHATGQWTKSDWKRFHKHMLSFRHELAVQSGVADCEIDLDVPTAHELVMAFCAKEGVVPGLTGQWSREKMLSRVEALMRLERNRTMSQPVIKQEPVELSAPSAHAEMQSTTEQPNFMVPPIPPPSPPVPSILLARPSHSLIPRPTKMVPSSSTNYAELLHQADRASKGEAENLLAPNPSTPGTAKRGIVDELQVAMNSRAAASPSMAGRLSGFLSGMLTKRKTGEPSISIPRPAHQPRGPAPLPKPPSPQEMTEVLRSRPITPLVMAAADTSSDSLLSNLKPLRHVDLVSRDMEETARLNRRRSSGSVKDLLVQYEDIRRKEEAEKTRVDGLRKQGSMRRLSDEAAAARPE
ncbi:hypothetical protein CALCODRAFT_358980 [Calocera cornea HHB12733]|uniref:Uncharacterized protein n=1 Tax=Calocera cornea HHB12733 TaxID=1353952 RepID=A0A165ENF1_9BASI|nr:hypothetical protein CALCODRAFT_358980 [Calocera cornea HHB12733]